MDEGDWKKLHGFAAMLDSAERTGAPVDMPEGSRRIDVILSDTFATQMAMIMRECSGYVGEMETTMKQQRAALAQMQKQVEIATTPQLLGPNGRKL